MLIPGEDLSVILSFNQRPFGAVSDDLNVAVVLPNGTRIVSNESLEGTEHVTVAASGLIGIENETIEVSAELVGIGNYSDVLGSDGDMVGFSLAISGIEGVVVEPEVEVDEYIHSFGIVNLDGELVGSTWSDSEYSMIGPFNWWRTSGELLGTNLTEIVMRVEGGEEGDELVSTMVLSSGTKNITHLYWWETTWDDVDGDGEFSVGDAWVVRTGQMGTHSGDYYVSFVRIGSCDWGWTVSDCPDGQICSDGACTDENVSEPEPEPEPEPEDNNSTEGIDDLHNSGSSEDDLPWVEVGVFFMVVFVGIALFSLQKRVKNG